MFTALPWVHWLFISKLFQSKPLVLEYAVNLLCLSYSLCVCMCVFASQRAPCSCHRDGTCHRHVLSSRSGKRNEDLSTTAREVSLAQSAYCMSHNFTETI